MRAAVISSPGCVDIEEVPDPAPAPDEVVIAVSGCGICGTDLHILAGELSPLPVTPGHEFAGRVVSVGRQGERDIIGKAVAVDPNLPCGHCYECRRGRGNLCENHSAIGVSTAGAAAQYVAVPLRNCFFLPTDIDLESAALIEPLSCVVRAFDVLGTRLASHVLIYGAGTMGLMMLELAKHSGAATVSVVDPNSKRLAIADELGCSAAVTSAADLDRPRGWDVVIDCTGVVDAIEDGLVRVGRGGTFLQFGVTAPDARARINPYRIYREEITVLGSMAVLNSFERAAEIYQAGVIDARVFISDRLRLDEYPTAIERFRAGLGRKIIVCP